MRHTVLAASALLAMLVTCGAPAEGQAAARGLRPRPLVLTHDGHWTGEAICYGPFRDGQSPGGAGPTRAQVREDVHIMLRHWRLVRLYGSVGFADTLLSVIAAERLPMRVLLGVWLQPEDRRDSTGRVLESLPAGRAANEAEVQAALRLCRRYPKLVAGVSVGNETQVSWSWNRVPEAVLIERIRQVRAGARAPVSTADDMLYWRSPASRRVAAEVDFVFTHLHPLWGGQVLDSALAWSEARYDEVRAMHPDRTVAIGEIGWATSKLTTGEQGQLIRGQVGEAEQKAFCDAARAWVQRARIGAFFFEAFDENWKGGNEPAEVEKHWGFYRADRTPKAAVPRGDER
ncbi:MAG: glycosyl hydrolase family 17 protein [Candidatus Eisenbacteria bacterium]